MLNKDLFNVLQISLACLFLMTSFITIGNAQRYLLKSIEEENPQYNGNAYVSFCVHFIIFALSNLAAPSISNVIGERVTMFIASLCQLVYNIQFLYPNGWILYVSSCIRGFGAGILWSAQGKYLTENSTKETITRNAGIFSGILQFNRLIGNMYIYLRFKSEKITKHERNELYGIMVGLCIMACILFSGLQKALFYKPSKRNALECLIATWNLFWTRDLLLLVPTFIYFGLLLSFNTFIYSNAIGFTMAFNWPDMKLIAFSGMLVGMGGVFGGFIFSLFGKKMSQWRRYPFVITGMLINFLAYILIFINLPDSSPHALTNDKAIINSNLTIALFSSFLLGLGATFFDTQIYATLATFFNREIIQAHALYRFTQGVSSGILFIFSINVGLYGIMSVIMLFSAFGTVSFCIVDLIPRNDDDDTSSDESGTIAVTE